MRSLPAIVMATVVSAAATDPTPPAPRDIGDVIIYTMAETTTSDRDVGLARQAGSEMLVRGWFKWNRAPAVSNWTAVPAKAHAMGALFGGGITCSALYDRENGLTQEQVLDMATRGPDGRLVDAWGRPGIRHGSLSSPAYLDYLFRWCREQIDAGADYLFLDEHTAALGPLEGYDDRSLAAFRRYLIDEWPPAKGWARNDPRWKSDFKVDTADPSLCAGGDMETFDYRAFLRARGALERPTGSANPLAAAWNRFRAVRDARAWRTLTDRIREHGRAKGRTVLISANGLAPLVDLQVMGIWDLWMAGGGRIDLAECQIPQWRGRVVQGHDLARRRVPVVFFHDWGVHDPPFPWLAVPADQRVLWMRVRAAEIFAAGAFFAFPVLGPFGCDAEKDGTLADMARLTAFYRTHREAYLRGRFLGTDALKASVDRLSLAAWTGPEEGVVRLHVINRAAKNGALEPRRGVSIDVPLARSPEGGASAVSPDWEGACPVRAEVSAGRLRVTIDEVQAYAMVVLRFSGTFDTPVVVDPVRVVPSLRWEPPLETGFRVRADGSVVNAGAMNGYLHGRLHTHLRGPPVFLVDARDGCAVAVRVRAVSIAGARLQVAIDGREASATDFPDRDGRNDAAAAEYDREIIVPIPAGIHRVTLDNHGADWLSIASIEFRGRFADAPE
ncbi:MAG: hypothetical protein FJ221_12255 [Lentisphaerae bacterium]|nr:hypothetical protein [Lentisphaerota bacterium]